MREKFVEVCGRLIKLSIELLQCSGWGFLSLSYGGWWMGSLWTEESGVRRSFYLWGYRSTSWLFLRIFELRVVLKVFKNEWFESTGCYAVLKFISQSTSSLTLDRSSRSLLQATLHSSKLLFHQAFMNFHKVVNLNHKSPSISNQFSFPSTQSQTSSEFLTIPLHRKRQNTFWQSAVKPDRVVS
jgi:hypothetical protein